MSSFYLDSIVDAERRLNHPTNILYKAIGQGQSENHGRKDRKEYKKLSPETKGLVGALAAISGVKETSKSLGIHPVTVGAYKNGKIASGTQPDPEVKEHRDSILDSIRGKASSVVSASLERLLDPGRIADAKTSEIATIAGIAMGIVEKTMPKQSSTFVAGNVVFMTPPVRKVEEYIELEVVPIKD